MVLITSVFVAALASIVSAHLEHEMSATKMKRDIEHRDNTAYLGALPL